MTAPSIRISRKKRGITLTGIWTIWKTWKFDTVVTAVYSPYTTTLASYDRRENGRPVFYAEGEFDQNAELITEKQETPPADLDVVPEDLPEMVKRSFISRNLYRKVQESWHITLPQDDLSAHTLRFMPPEGKVKRLAVFLKEDGTWQEVDAQYIGSYLAFQAKGSAMEMALVSTVPVWWVWLFPAALALLVLWLLIRLIRRLRKKHGKRISSGKPLPAPAPEKRRKKKRLLILLIALLVPALIAGILTAVALLNPGIVDDVQACRLIQSSVKEKEQSMTLTVDASYGEQTLQLQADVERTQLEGKTVAVIRQNGNALYFCDGVVFLENGKGYRLSSDYPDYSQLLDKTLDLYRHVEITESDGNYSITASGAEAAELLRILIPPLAEKFSGIDALEVRLQTENAVLKQIRFLSEGTLNGKSYALDAALELLDTPPAQIPQRVQTGILTGAQDVTTVVTKDLMALANAWTALENRNPLCADPILTADCGPLKLSEQLEFYRDTSGDREIFSLQKNGYGLYFTEGTVCDRNGLAVSAEQARLADSARLLELAYDLCQSAGVAVSNGVYTISLDEAGMTQAAAAIAPETMDMDIAFGEGTVQIRLSGEELESISFTISGSVKVVVADVPVSLSGKLVMAQSQREFTVPEAVRKVLEK